MNNSILVISNLSDKIYLSNKYEACKNTNQTLCRSKRDITDKFIKWEGDKEEFAEFFNLDLEIDFDLFTDGKFWINGKDFADKGELVGKVNGQFWIVKVGAEGKFLLT